MMERWLSILFKISYSFATYGCCHPCYYLHILKNILKLIILTTLTNKMHLMELSHIYELNLYFLFYTDNSPICIINHKYYSIVKSYLCIGLSNVS